MTPEQKARVITELIQTREAAAGMIEYHDREALRYRLQYKNLGDEITKLFVTPVIGEEIQEKPFNVVFPGFYFNCITRKVERLLTNKKRTGKLNR